MKLFIALIIIFKIVEFIYRFMKGQKDGKQGRPPQLPPADAPAEGERDVSEEEKKFKKWLEDVFGPGQAEGRESREDESAGWHEDENDYEGEDGSYGGYGGGEDEGYADRAEDEIYGRGEIEPAMAGQESRPETAPDAARHPAPAPAAPSCGQAAAFVGNPMAYGLIMAEIFARPKALRPKRQTHSCRNFL